MAENLISEIFDVEAIKAQQAEIEKLLEDSKKSMVEFATEIKEASRGFDGLSLSDIQKQNEKATKGAKDALTELEKVQKQLADTKAKLAFAQSEEGKAMLEQVTVVKSLLKEQNDVVKVSAQEQKALEDVTKALTQQVKSITSAENANKALRKAAKDLDVTTEDGQKTLEQYNKVIDENQKFINSNSDAYTQQKQNIGNYKSALEGVEAGTMSLRAAQKILREELGTLALQTENGTKGTEEQKAAYAELVTTYGKFTDVVGDAQSAVKGASDDFVGLSVTLTAVKAGFTVFQAGQSAMAMFGVENEKLIETMQQLQATQTFLNAINEIANMLRQKDVFLAQLQILTESKSIIVRQAATIAQKALNAAMNANPAMLIVTALIALVAVLASCSGAMEDNTTVTKAQAESYTDLASSVFFAQQKMVTLTNELTNLKNAGADSDSVMNAANNVLKEYGVTSGKTAEESEKLLKITKEATKENKAGRDAYLAAQQGADGLRKTIFDLNQKKKLGIELTDDEEKSLSDARESLGVYNKALKENEKSYIAYNVAIGGVNKAIKDEAAEAEKAEQTKKEAAEAAKERAKAAAEERKALVEATNTYVYESQKLAILENVTDEKDRAKALDELEAETTRKRIDQLQTRLNSEKMLKSERLKIESEIAKYNQELRTAEIDVQKQIVEDQKRLNEQRAADAKSTSELVYEQNKLIILQTEKDEVKRNAKLKALDKERVDNHILELNRLLENDKLTVSERNEISKQLIAIQQEGAQKEIDIAKEKADKVKEQEQKAADFKKEMTKQIIDLALEAVGLLFEAMQQSFDIELEAISKDKEAFEKSFDEKQQLLDDSVVSDQTRKEKQAALDAEKAAKTKELTDEEIAVKQKAAKWEKAQAISSIWISSAQAAMQATAGAAAAGLGFPAVLVAFLALIAGVAAAQTALIAAQPLPAYEKGTEFHKGGKAFVSEHGQIEVSETPDKRLIVTDQPTILDLPRGSKVYPNVEKFAASRSKQGGSNSNNKDVIKAIKESKATQVVNLDKRGIFVVANQEASRRTYIANALKLGK